MVSSIIFVFCIVIVLPGTFTFTEKRSLLDFIFSPCKCRCGVPNREAKIVGGEITRSHEFPWGCLIQINGEKSIPATIINNKYVITAASQLKGFTPYDLKVTVGQFERCAPDTSSNNVSVEKIILHPDFYEKTRSHDIALVKLSAPLNFERRISPICLSTPSTKYLGQVATLFGWAKNNEEMACRPRKLGVPVLNCKETTEQSYLDKGCLGIVGLPSPVCEVDAGGPVMFRSYSGIYELIGILGKLNKCDQEARLAEFTTINDHLNWITHNTRDACYCIKT